MNVELVSNKLLRNYIFRILSVLRKKGRDQKWKWRVKIRFLWCLRTNFSEYIKLTYIRMQVWIRNSDVDEFKLMTDYVCWWHLSDFGDLKDRNRQKHLVLVANGDCDVANIMLVTTLRWRPILDVGDITNMLVIFFVILVIFHVLNRSPASWFGHQHLKVVTHTFGLQHPSPTFNLI